MFRLRIDQNSFIRILCINIEFLSQSIFRLLMEVVQVFFYDFVFSQQNIKRDFDNLNFELDELTAIRNEHIEEKEKLTAGNESLAAELQVCKTLAYLNGRKKRIVL